MNKYKSQGFLGMFLLVSNLVLPISGNQVETVKKHTKGKESSNLYSLLRCGPMCNPFSVVGKKTNVSLDPDKRKEEVLKKRVIFMGHYSYEKVQEKVYEKVKEYGFLVSTCNTSKYFYKWHKRFPMLRFLLFKQQVFFEPEKYISFISDSNNKYDLYVQSKFYTSGGPAYVFPYDTFLVLIIDESNCIMGILENPSTQSIFDVLGIN